MKRKKIKLNRFLMLFSLVIVTALMLSVGCMLYWKTERYMEDKTDLMQSMQMNQTVKDVRKQFEDIYQTMDSLRNTSTLIHTLDRLRQKQLTSYEQVVLSQNLESSLSNLNKGNELIDSITIWTENDQYSSKTEYASYYFQGHQLPLSSFGSGIQFVARNRTYEALGPEFANIEDEALQRLLEDWNQSSYFICPITGPSGTLGVLRMKLNFDAFRHILPYGEWLSVFDANEEVLYRGSEAAENSMERGPFYRDSGFGGIHVALHVEESGFHRKQLRFLALYSFITLGVSAMLAFSLSQLISKKAMSPLHSLVKWINRHRSLNTRWDPTGEERDKRRSLTMRDRFFIYFLLTILFPVVLFVTVFYFHSSTIISHELENTFKIWFDKTSHRIELFTEQKESAMARLAYDAFVVSYVFQPDNERQRDMDQLIFDSSFPTLSEDALGIYGLDNKLIYSNRVKYSPRIDPAFFDQMRTNRKHLFYWLPPGAASSTISLGIGIADLNRDAQPLGYLKTDIDNVYFANLYADLKGNGKEAFIMDGNGLILSHPDAERTGQKAEIPFRLNGETASIFRDGDGVYYAMKISSLPWYFVARYDASLIQDQVIRLFLNDFYLLVVLFLLTLLFSYFMSNYLVRPLASLHNRYWNIDLDGVAQLGVDKVYTIDEVDQLRISFNAMMERIHQLVQNKLDAHQEKLVLEFEKKELHMEALQAQITPHFLYNTLENIMYMVENGERELAVDTIGLLSRLFRYAMGKESPLTTLGEEIAYAQSYVKIMSCRYKSKLICDWDTDLSLYPFTVNKMILQPIIENAIRHCLPVLNQVHITVCCRRRNDCLEIAVRDNGPGIEPSKLEELRLQLDKRDRRKVGLYNVNSRIKLHFGTEFGLRIESRGTGTTVTLRLPLHKARAMEAYSES
ncbi:histidine kinase [Paenibacillus sp. J5C_2022]|uniref:sensor histidine kinase n=1 Tax=Paenibacillus sp. J5C2022 TaxID=2977129 RepID=UPI0021CFDC61|nr:sensor histidine kinase [Paenibacillus sp. J5C2022]MCU6711921.1 histidine kinase [Paenibacillus sp. J5C2022]